MFLHLCVVCFYAISIDDASNLCLVQGGADHLFVLKRRVVTVPKLQKDDSNDLVRYNAVLLYTQVNSAWPSLRR